MIDTSEQKPDTHYFAKASGDRTYITWLQQRLVHVYKESEYMDFVWTLDAFAEAGAKLKAAEEKIAALEQALNAY